MDRRSLLLGALGVGVTAATAEGGACPTDLTMEKLVKWFGSDAVLAEIATMISAKEAVSLEEIRRRLNRQQRKERRARKAAQRRERHVGDTVLYRGPVYLDQAVLTSLEAGCHKSRGSSRSSARHAIIVGHVMRGYRIGETVVPTGSRVLIDARRPIGQHPIAEVVQTLRGAIRLHLWSRQQAWETEQPLLPLTYEEDQEAGRVYATNSAREVGLLGLPLSKGEQ